MVRRAKNPSLTPPAALPESLFLQKRSAVARETLLVYTLHRRMRVKR